MSDGAEPAEDVESAGAESVAGAGSASSVSDIAVILFKTLITIAASIDSRCSLNKRLVKAARANAGRYDHVATSPPTPVLLKGATWLIFVPSN